MSLICFPFKNEKLLSIQRNVQIALSAHKNIKVILLVGAVRNECYLSIEKWVQDDLSVRDDVVVRVILQKSIGEGVGKEKVDVDLEEGGVQNGLLLKERKKKREKYVRRSGKGDGMNTALEWFLNAHKDPSLYPVLNPEMPLQQIHFYDADITSFSSAWITRAETFLKSKPEVDILRHYFYRSSTDGLITLFITRIGFAYCYPRTYLPRIKQPLGGELIMRRHVVEEFVKDKKVRRISDWGIDTGYTFKSIQNGFKVYDIYAPEGKIHGLYDGLDDLKGMCCECFWTLCEFYRNGEVVKEIEVDGCGDGDGEDVKYVCCGEGEDKEDIPEKVKSKIGYDIEASLKLLGQNWSEGQEELSKCYFDKDVVEGMLNCRKWPVFNFMNENAWVRAYVVFLKHYDPTCEDWKELLFKMWVARVLNYTMRHVIRGYDIAMQENEKFVSDVYRERSRQLEQGTGEGQHQQNGVDASVNGVSNAVEVDSLQVSGEENFNGCLNGHAVHSNGHIRNEHQI